MKPASADPCFEPCLDLLRTATQRPAREQALTRLLRQDEDHVLRFLTEHRIDQHVYRQALDLRPDIELPEALHESLRWAQRRAAVATMLQFEAAQFAAEALAGEGVHYVFFKGFHLGEALYGDAVLRPAADIDVLIAEADQQRAIVALGQSDFSPVTQPGQPPYELALNGHGTQLDLHWHLFRPQRSRQPLTDWILSSRQQHAGLWYPDEAATLVILLLNPSLTDHVTQQLSHAVDLDRWLRRSLRHSKTTSAKASEVDWSSVVDCLDGSGLKTAAWTMLDWTRRHFSTPVPSEVLRRLEPGAIRRAYLRAWLKRDPARLYLEWPSLVRAGFSLALHDSAADVRRALQSIGPQ